MREKGGGAVILKRFGPCGAESMFCLDLLKMGGML